MESAFGSYLHAMSSRRSKFVTGCIAFASLTMLACRAPNTARQSNEADRGDRNLVLCQYRTDTCLLSSENIHLTSIPEKYRNLYELYVHDTLHHFTALSDSCKRALLPEDVVVGRPVSVALKALLCKFDYHNEMKLIRSYYNEKQKPWKMYIYSTNDGPILTIQSDTLIEIQYSSHNWE